VSMPITLPAALGSGPPESPRGNAALVCSMAGSVSVVPQPRSPAGIVRSVA
jgi:hypothetical protein